MRKRGTRYYNEAITIFNEKMDVAAASGLAPPQSVSAA
jgi:hypothetical protein